MNYMYKGGGVDSKELLQEVKRAEACAKTLLEIEGVETLKHGFVRIDCNKWWCPSCGNKGGKINKRRVHDIKARVGEQKYCRQWTFTVPEEHRSRFMSKKGLNKLVDAVHRLITAYYPKKSCVITVHVLAEKSAGFAPHVNVDIFEEKACILKETPERLEAVRETWLRSLSAMIGGERLEVVDVFYNFKKNERQVWHSMKYMTRPLGINNSVEFLNKCNDGDLLRFLVLELKGYHFIRYWGPDMKVKKSELSIDERARRLMGEPFRIVGMITQSEFHERFRHFDLIERSPGCYITKESQGKHKSRRAGP